MNEPTHHRERNFYEYDDAPRSPRGQPADVIIKTIGVAEDVVGYVSSYEEDGQPAVTYWLGKAYWGQGFATRARTSFLKTANTKRPIHARVAQDNRGSLRVLQKCGFVVKGEGIGFANARGPDVSEYLLTLDAI